VASSLETLHVPAGYSFFLPYRCRGRGRPKAKFPPIRELCIEEDWPYYASAVATTWDLLKLSVLRLRSINLAFFTASLPADQLSGLTKFECLLKDDGNEANWVLNLISIICKIKRLEELVVQCYHPHKLLAALENHKSTPCES
jgi:hypothetical protein